MNPTAWGNVKMYFGTPEQGGEMPSSLMSIGNILEGSLNIEKEDGTTLELYEEGHVLRDMMQLEPTLRVNATIIGIPEATRSAFWETEVNGAGEAKKVSVKSMVSNKKYAVKFAAEQVPGSDTFEAPYCSVNMGPAYSSEQGWTADVVITILKGDSGKLFDFGVVPAVPSTPEG